MESKKGRKEAQMKGNQVQEAHASPLREACLSEKKNPMAREIVLRCCHAE
jgi:hypothetical protein